MPQERHPKARQTGLSEPGCFALAKTVRRCRVKRSRAPKVHETGHCVVVCPVGGHFKLDFHTELGAEAPKGILHHWRGLVWELRTPAPAEWSEARCWRSRYLERGMALRTAEIRGHQREKGPQETSHGVPKGTAQGSSEGPAPGGRRGR